MRSERLATARRMAYSFFWNRSGGRQETPRQQRLLHSVRSFYLCLHDDAWFFSRTNSNSNSNNGNLSNKFKSDFSSDFLLMLRLFCVCFLRAIYPPRPARRGDERRPLSWPIGNSDRFVYEQMTRRVLVAITAFVTICNTDSAPVGVSSFIELDLAVASGAPAIEITASEIVFENELYVRHAEMLIESTIGATLSGGHQTRLFFLENGTKLSLRGVRLETGGQVAVPEAFSSVAPTAVPFS